MLKKIYHLLQPADRKKCMGIALVVFVVSVLNFAGLASIFPLLKVALTEGVDAGFALSPAYTLVAVLLFIVLKNLAVFGLTRVQTNFLTRQYKHFSYQLFCRYYKRGLLFIRNRGAVQLANDVNALCITFSTSVLQALLVILGESLLILLVLAALFCWMPMAAVFLFVAFLPLIVFYVLVVRTRLRACGKEGLEVRRKQARMVVETFRGYSEIEINNAFPLQTAGFFSGIASINNIRKKMEGIKAIPAALSEVAVILGLALLLFLEKGDKVFVGGVFALAAFRLMPAVRSVLYSWTALQQASYCVDTLIEEMAKDAEEEAADDLPLSFNEELKADNVSFAYSEGEQVLADFNCSIRKGECVGVQGASGVGKSTLFNILLGFFTPASGCVYVDGQPLGATNIKSWHKMVGYVPQEIFILKGSLAENVALGASVVDEERVREVLQQVQLAEWLQTLPEGLDTQLGEAGSRLSGGQKQRIGIARALYKNAEILFFDEATSALDNETETEIVQTLTRLSEHKSITMVVIAHRESTFSFCDRIIKLG